MACSTAATTALAALSRVAWSACASVLSLTDTRMWTGLARTSMAVVGYPADAATALLICSTATDSVGFAGAEEPPPVHAVSIAANKPHVSVLRRPAVFTLALSVDGCLANFRASVWPADMSGCPYGQPPGMADTVTYGRAGTWHRLRSPVTTSEA